MKEKVLNSSNICPVLTAGSPNGYICNLTISIPIFPMGTLKQAKIKCFAQNNTHPQLRNWDNIQIPGACLWKFTFRYIRMFSLKAWLQGHKFSTEGLRFKSGVSTYQLHHHPSHQLWSTPTQMPNSAHLGPPSSTIFLTEFQSALSLTFQVLHVHTKAW